MSVRSSEREWSPGTTPDMLGADRGEERGELGAVLEAGRRLDAARDVDRPRRDRVDRGADVVGRQAAGEHEPAGRIRATGVARELPVEHPAAAAAAGGRG